MRSAIKYKMKNIRMDAFVKNIQRPAENIDFGNIGG